MTSTTDDVVAESILIFPFKLLDFADYSEGAAYMDCVSDLPCYLNDAYLIV